MIAAIINPVTNEIMGISITDPTPTNRLSQPKLMPVVEEGTLANIAPNSNA